ncbi:MAG: hypothetical protein BGO59_31095 [Spirosoma sp. 48-14]|nr:MAG: hypothetical protein BGO59_31095 [Spirosoma sp. 48-14]
MAGVYQILNTVNGKCYIGSTKKFLYRYSQHKYGLENRKHHSKHLARAYDKYGANSFEFNLLEVVSETERLSDLLLEIENKYIIQYNSINLAFGYNKSIAIPSCYGAKHKENAKTRLKDKSVSPETRAKLGVRMENHFATKLTNEQVREIKLILAKGCRSIDVAKYFNLDVSVVRNIRNGRTWVPITVTHNEVNQYALPKGLCINPSYAYRNPNKPNKKLLEEGQVLLIKYLLSIGERTVDVAEFFDVKEEIISGIKRGKTYKDIELSEKDYKFFQVNFTYDDYDEVKKTVKGRAFKSRAITTPKGERHANAKLNTEDVLKIKDLLEQGLLYTQIAERFNVSTDTIQKIRNGRNWVHVTGFTKLQEKRVSKRVNASGFKSIQTKLTAENLLEIKERLSTGEKCVTIAKSFNVSLSLISSIKRGKAWSDFTGITKQETPERLNDNQVKLIKYLLLKGKPVYIAQYFNFEPYRILQIKYGKVYKHVELTQYDLEVLQKSVPNDLLINAIEQVKGRTFKNKSKVKKEYYNNISKLKQSDVLEIVELLNQKVPFGEIGRQYGVSGATIQRIYTGANWVHVTGFTKSNVRYKPKRNVISGEKNHLSKLTNDEVLEIKQLLKSGKTGLSIANQFKVHPTLISSIKQGKSWMHI